MTWSGAAPGAGLRRLAALCTLVLALGLLVLPISARAGARQAVPVAQLHHLSSTSRGRGPETGRSRLAAGGTITPVTTTTGTVSATPTETVVVVPEGTLTVTPTGTSSATPLPGTSTPSPTLEVSVISVKIEKAGARPDWNLSRPSMKYAGAGSTLTLSIYYTVTGAARTNAVADQWTVTHNHRIVFRRRHSHRLGSPTSNLYRDHVRFKLGGPGTYVYTGRVTVKRITDAGRTTIRARRKKR